MLKLAKIILIVLIVINIIISIFLLFDFQVFESPETIVSIDIVEINSEEMTLQTKMQIDNPNSFDLIVNDFKVDSETIDGIDIGELLIQGGTVIGKQSKTFVSIDKFALQGQSFKILKNEITHLKFKTFLFQ